MPKTKTVSASVEDDIYDRVDRIAKIDGRKRANIVQICLEKYLPELERKLGLDTFVLEDSPNRPEPPKPTQIPSSKKATKSKKTP